LTIWGVEKLTFVMYYIPQSSIREVETMEERVDNVPGLFTGRFTALKFVANQDVTDFSEGKYVNKVRTIKCDILSLED